MVILIWNDSAFEADNDRRNTYEYVMPVPTYRRSYCTSIPR